MSGLDLRDGGRVGKGRESPSLPTPPPTTQSLAKQNEPKEILLACYLLVMAINVFMTLWTIKQCFDI